MSNQTQLTVPFNGTGPEAASVSADALQVEPLDPRRLEHHPVMTRVSWTLVGLALVGAGFVGGARLAKHNASSSTGFPGGFSLPSGFNPSALGGAGGLGGLGGGATTGTRSADSGAVTGRIVLVSGGKVYVQDAAGKKTAVSLSSGTEVSKGQAVPSSALSVGDTVIVSGTADSSGTVNATAIAATSGAAAAPTSTTAP
jgi:hypothetical protein